jgi:roundabout, axon guidance receptor 2
MFPNQDHGRMSVSEDGTLVIEPVQKEDAGEYICKGLSIAGSAYAKARLDVKGTLNYGLFIVLQFVELFI